MVGKRSEEGGERSKKGEERWPGRRLIPLNPFLLQPADNINKLKCNEIINALFMAIFGPEDFPPETFTHQSLFATAPLVQYIHQPRLKSQVQRELIIQLFSLRF